MECRMDGRTAVITGGSLGLGKAMAMEFSKSGANVAMVARRAEVLEEAKSEVLAAVPGAAVGGYPCDMCDAGAIEAMHQSVVSELGDVDIVVNNAGTSRAMSFMDITDELWNEVLELKLLGPVRLIRLTFPGMKDRRWGRIINVLNSGAKAPRAGGAPTAVSRRSRHGVDKGPGGRGRALQHTCQRHACRPHRERPASAAALEVGFQRNAGRIIRQDGQNGAHGAGRQA